jgi:hypothetical protein
MARTPPMLRDGLPVSLPLTATTRRLPGAEA